MISTVQDNNTYCLVCDYFLSFKQAKKNKFSLPIMWAEASLFGLMFRLTISMEKYKYLSLEEFFIKRVYLSIVVNLIPIGWVYFSLTIVNRWQTSKARNYRRAVEGNFHLSIKKNNFTVRRLNDQIKAWDHNFLVRHLTSIK